MLYTASIELIQGEEPIKVVLMVKTELDGKVVYHSLKHLLGNPTAIQTLKTYGDRVFVGALDKNKPLVTKSRVLTLPGQDVNPNGSTDITSVFSIFTQYKQEFDEAFFKRLEELAKNANLRFADLVQLKTAYDDFIKYKNGEETYKIVAPPLTYVDTQATSAAVAEYNAKLGPQFKHITSEINKTNFMETPDDTFYVKLPEYERLRNYDVDINSLLPSRDELFKPYPHPVYDTPYYARIFKEGPAQRKETLQGLSSIMTLTPQQLNDVPRIDFSLVEGDSSNNDLDIQPNEEDFYNGLLELIRYDIQQSFPDEDEEALFSSCTCSPRLKQFLDGLIERLSAYNWSHNGKFPAGYMDDEDDREDDDGEGESAMFYGISGQIVDGPLILSNYIEQACNSGLGFVAYAQAIVKLARWGHNKPTVLKLAEYPRYLDLNQFLIRSTTGNLNTMKPKLVDGFEHVLRGVVIFDDKFRDLDFREKVGVENPRINIPLGVACDRYFESGAKQIVFMSMIDLVNKYRLGDAGNFIKGVTYDGNSFKIEEPAGVENNIVNLRFVAEAAANSADKGVVLYESDSVREITLDFGVSNLASLGVLFEFLYSPNGLSKWYDLLKFSSKEEFNNKVAENSLPKEMYVKTNIAGEIVPIVLLASREFDNATVSDRDYGVQLSVAANAFSKVMTSRGFTTENAIWSGSAKVEEPQKSNLSVADSLKQMNAFSGQAKTAPEPVKEAAVSAEAEIENDSIELVEEASPLDSPIIPVESTDKITTLVDDDGKIIGGFTSKVIEGKKVFILVGMDKVPADAPPSRNNLKALEPLMWDAISNMVTGNVRNMQVRFDNPQVPLDHKKRSNEAWRAVAGKK